MYTITHTVRNILTSCCETCGSFAQSVLVLWGGEGGRRRIWRRLLHDGSVDDWLDVVASVSGVNHTLPLAVLQLLLSEDPIETHVWCLRLDDSTHTHTQKGRHTTHKKSQFQFLKENTPVAIGVPHAPHVPPVLLSDPCVIASCVCHRCSLSVRMSAR